MKRAIFIIIIILLLGVFVFSAWQVVSILQEYRQGEQSYEELEQFISIPETAPKATVPEAEPEETEATEATQPQPEEDVILWPEVDFKALKEINSDVVGWIYIPDTDVNYPIVQGRDNDYYLHRLLTGEYNSAGSIFMEAGITPDFSWQNSPIYGHNMKNGTMFADVTGYKSQEFYDAHPVALLLTPEKNYVVHIFSGYVVSTWGDAWNTAFTEAEFADWLQGVQRKSYFASDVVPDVGDRVLTFSTCTYETDDARFVVHGVLEAYDKA